jgi:alkanesulfonate monooxygenase SsuD/methylene tetrahydromethanopterin reductase-like flavin-dependent oxidoreductase (luciferase family)
VEFCDGWMPFDRRDLDEQFTELKHRAEAVGRDPATLSLTIYGAKPAAQRLAELEEIGAERALLTLPQGPETEVLDRLDEYTALI